MATPLEPFGIPASPLIHPEVEVIEAENLRWARRLGLVGDARGEERLRRARIAQAAARIAWHAPVERVVLFAQWLTWIIVIDDLQDEAGPGLDSGAVHRAYARLEGILEGQGTDADAPAVERALAELWSRTATPMSRAWRERFIGHVRLQRDAFIEQTRLRRSGRVPTLDEYPRLRRHTNSIFAFDLSEPVYALEIAPALLPAWLALCEPINDLMAWCNDIVSVARDAADGETTNYVFVFQHALGCDTPTAVARVRGRIQERWKDLATAEQALRREARRLALDTPGLLRLTATLCQVPSAHLGWLLESSRYQSWEAPIASP
ncbi:terpene synthase family protein [Archangium primigenium]|uniref:terpene synthase family protein n=1 Tax=[Archangium] primigenium TaxID=2792470 RepID=UPI00195DF332|nr:terpene synthase family protein [Archangium primigenium]MBM7116347.1 hypothetical protein [Archangium primigenium]